jgi:hypothetical protein
MKRLLAILLVLSGPSLAQFTSTAHHVYAGPTLPAHCSATAGDVFVINNTTPTQLYLCTATDTWTIGGGSGAGATAWTRSSGGVISPTVPTDSVASGNHYLVFDGSTANPGDGSTLTWSCGSGTGAQCTTTWTVPAGVVAIRALAWSGGGAGAGSSNGYVGAGGSGGGYEDTVCPVSGTVSIAVGLGGAAVSGYNPGLAGGSTTVGSCVTVLGGGGGVNGTDAAGWPGYVAGSSQWGWVDTTSENPGAPTIPGATCRYSSAPVRLDGGGCGGSSSLVGGTAIGGGGGGGGGVTDGIAVIAGATSGLGGAGGAGGGYNTGTSAFVACAAGMIPGGGGGAAGAHSGLSGTSCAGARGEVRVSY